MPQRDPVIERLLAKLANGADKGQPAPSLTPEECACLRSAVLMCEEDYGGTDECSDVSDQECHSRPLCIGCRAAGYDTTRSALIAAEVPRG
jgi:hypothetical protein